MSKEISLMSSQISFDQHSMAKAFGHLPYRGIEGGSPPYTTWLQHVFFQKDFKWKKKLLQLALHILFIYFVVESGTF